MESQRNYHLYLPKVIGKDVTEFLDSVLFFFFSDDILINSLDWPEHIFVLSLQKHLPTSTPLHAPCTQYLNLFCARYWVKFLSPPFFFFPLKSLVLIFKVTRHLTFWLVLNLQLRAKEVSQLAFSKGRRPGTVNKFSYFICSLTQTLVIWNQTILFIPQETFIEFYHSHRL